MRARDGWGERVLPCEARGTRMLVVGPGAGDGERRVACSRPLARTARPCRRHRCVALSHRAAPPLCPSFARARPCATLRVAARRDRYFTGEHADHSSEAPSAKTLSVFKDPNPVKRTVSSLSFHPDGGRKIAVAFSLLQFQDERADSASNQSCARLRAEGRRGEGAVWPKGHCSIRARRGRCAAAARARERWPTGDGARADRPASHAARRARAPAPAHKRVHAPPA